MGILTSLFAGVSGINASGQQISVVGDNIANINTIGFKSARAEFVDVLSGNLGSAGGASQIGSGSRLNGVTQNFTQGSLESSGVTTDLAIDGNGFFIIQDTSGVFYSRSGMFRLNNQQFLVNEQGQSVLGFGVTPAGIPNGALSAIDLSSVSSVPQATQTVEVSVNLDPNETALTGGATGFDPLDPVNTSNFQTGIRIFDTQGNPRSLLVYFRKNDASTNSWYWYAGVNRGELDVSTYGMTQGTATQFFPVQSGSLSFNTDGTLATVSGNTAGTQLSFDFDTNGDDVIDASDTNPVTTPLAWNWGNGAGPTNPLAFDFGTQTSSGGTGADRTTQFGGSSASGVNNFVRFMNQDGFAAGSLQAVDIDESGFVTGSFSSGETNRLAQIALANFPNVNGLNRLGGNSLAETNSSGNPIIGSPNQSEFGAVRSGFLEQSNTDLAEQFVKLIIAQRAFQANTRTISTTNDLLSSLVALGN